jgi:hypothetical protein
VPPMVTEREALLLELARKGKLVPTMFTCCPPLADPFSWLREVIVGATVDLARLVVCSIYPRFL